MVVRADSSGTSFVFTKHLSAISPDFAKNIGANKMPNWPVGTRSKGNEGITASMHDDAGIDRLHRIRLCPQSEAAHRHAGKQGRQLCRGDHRFGKAALASAEMPEDLIAWASDPEGKDAYPIVTYTWMIFYKKYENQAKAKALRALINYGLTDGQKDAEALGYIPLPPEVVTKVKAAAEAIS